VKSAHDCSEGGLAVAIAESCVSQQIARDTPRLIGAQINLTEAFPSETAAKVRLDALLFGETQARVVISTSALDAVKNHRTRQIAWHQRDADWQGGRRNAGDCHNSGRAFLAGDGAL